LVDRLPLDDAGGDLLDRIGSGCDDLTLSVDRTAEGIHDATEEPLADRDGKQFASGLDLGALFDAQVVPEDDCTNLGLLKVEGETDDSVSEVEHLVGHGVGEALDLGDTVGHFADEPDVLALDSRLNPGDLCFDFLEDVAHRN
jgi:hypothetical protein